MLEQNNQFHSVIAPIVPEQPSVLEQPLVPEQPEPEAVFMEPTFDEKEVWEEIVLSSEEENFLSAAEPSSTSSDHVAENGK